MRLLLLHTTVPRRRPRVYTCSLCGAAAAFDKLCCRKDGQANVTAWSEPRVWRLHCRRPVRSPRGPTPTAGRPACLISAYQRRSHHNNLSTTHLHLCRLSAKHDCIQSTMRSTTTTRIRLHFSLDPF